MITINKEEKKISIKADFAEVLLNVDGTEYKVPLTDGEGFITNIPSEMNDVKAWGLTELECIEN